MTNEELELIKKAILDSTEAYVDTRFERLPFVKTEIGIIEGQGTNKGNKVRLRKVVSSNGTVIKEGALYDDILSVGNIIYPNNSIVYIFVPNAQYNNMFIMGQLDDTPANIKGGTINIGNGSFIVDNNGNVTMTKGSIKIGNNAFKVDTNGNMNIGNNAFSVDKNGNTTITKGNINIGNGKFKVDSSGNADVHGDIKVDGSLKFYWGGDGSSYGKGYRDIITVEQDVGASGDPMYVYMTADNGVYVFNRASIEDLSCGDTFSCMKAYFYGNVYNSNGGVVFVSDKNAKHDIESLDLEKSANFIYSQNPVSYKFNDGTSNRKHHGFIAQEVKETMGEEDWGIYIDQSVTDETKKNEVGSIGLRYDEYIADLVATCQYQKQQIDEMKKDIEDLKSKLEVNTNGND